MGLRRKENSRPVGQDTVTGATRRILPVAILPIRMSPMSVPAECRHSTMGLTVAEPHHPVPVRLHARTIHTLCSRMDHLILLGRTANRFRRCRRFPRVALIVTEADERTKRASELLRQDREAACFRLDRPCIALSPSKPFVKDLIIACHQPCYRRTARYRLQ